MVERSSHFILMAMKVAPKKLFLEHLDDLQMVPETNGFDTEYSRKAWLKVWCRLEFQSLK